jgi:peptidoglycan/xylan/chitin deacetylase (PgdA/CDA1 family)
MGYTYDKFSKSGLLLPVLLFIINNALLAQNIGEISIKKWSGDKASAFSFSFDDAFLSQYLYVRPVLNQYDFNATFYLSTSGIDNGSSNKGTWAQWTQAAAEGHELGSHSVTHPHMEELTLGTTTTPGTIRYEMYQSKTRIETQTGTKCLTFAYPFAEYNSTVLQAAMEFFQAARADGSNPIDASIRGMSLYDLTSYEVWFNSPRTSLSDDNDEFAEWQDAVNETIEEGKWLTFFAHEVVPFSQLAGKINDGAWYPMSREWLSNAADWLKTQSDNGNVWVETIANVVKYMKERDNYSASVLSSTSNEIKIFVTDNLDNNIYSYPLTADVVVPFGWESVAFQQGSRTAELNPFISGGVKYVRVEVIPDGGTVILKNNSAAGYSLSGKISYHNEASSAVSNVTVALSGNNVSLTSLTNASGMFSFAGLTPGIYSVSFSKAAEAGGLTATDALEILRYMTNAVTFDSLQIKAADLNANSNVNATDALLLLNRITGKINSFSIPDWLFDKDSVTITINDSNLEQNIKAIAAGDVNRSFTP